MKTKLILKTGLVGVIGIWLLCFAGTFAYAATVTVNSGAGGHMLDQGGTPVNGEVSVSDGTDVTFTFEANSGYYIDYAETGIRRLGPVAEHTFTNITGSHSLNAYFGEIDGSVRIVNSKAELNAALAEVRDTLLTPPVRTILIESGDYFNTNWWTVSNVNGAEDDWITVRGLDPSDPPRFRATYSRIWNIANSSYVIVSNLIIEGETENGMFIGGSKVPIDELNPMNHVIVENITFLSIGSPWGNADALKPASVDYFIIRNCYFEGWPESAIDTFGQYGIIENNKFFSTATRGMENDTIMIKGGSRDIIVRENFFFDPVPYAPDNRMIDIGGDTGPQYFRTPIVGFGGPVNYESKDIEVAGNRFVGTEGPICWNTQDSGIVHHNTFVLSERYVIRILQHNSGYEFLPSHDGVFNNNLIVYDTSLPRWYRIGNFSTGPNPATAPDTFTFADNVWYKLNTGGRTPEDTESGINSQLPTVETGGVYGLDPGLECFASYPTIDPADLRIPEKMIIRSSDGRFNGIGADAYSRSPNDLAARAYDMSVIAVEGRPFAITLEGRPQIGAENSATVVSYAIVGGIDNETIAREDGGDIYQLTTNPGYIYTANSGFTGQDSFSFKINDGDRDSVNTATVSVTVIPEADAPAAVDDSAATDEEVPVIIDVLANDNGAKDLSTLTVSPIPRTDNGPNNGTAVANMDGTITYIPEKDFFGTDSFRYGFKDNSGVPSDEGTVIITVNDVYDPPVVDDPIDPDAVFVDNPAALRTELQNLQAGRTIVITAGTYPGQYDISGKNGSAENPITIMGEDPDNPPVFTGSGTVNRGIGVVNSSFITLRNLRLEGYEYEGLYIGDGSSEADVSNKVPFSELSPSHDITVENVAVIYTGGQSWSSYNALEIIRTDNLTLRGITVEDWGILWQAAGILLTGCQNSVIEKSLLSRNGLPNSASGIILRGGSRDILVQGNFFRYAGSSAILMGGSTNSAYLRDPVDYTAKDIEVAGNRIIVGARSYSVFWTSSEGGDVHHNTIIMADSVYSSVMFFNGSAHDGRFYNNLILYNFDKLYGNKEQFLRRSGFTEANGTTFSFDNNAWFQLDVDEVGSQLPVDYWRSIYSPETNAVYQVDPEFPVNLRAKGNNLYYLLMAMEPGYLSARSLDPRLNDIGADWYDSGEPSILGDVNGDERVTIADAVLVAQSVVGMNVTLAIPENADVDEDGFVTLKDAILIVRIANEVTP